MGGGNTTSLDETLLYSGNDPITAILGYKDYTLLDNVTNYDYIYIEVKTVAIDNSVNYVFTGTYKQPNLVIDSLVYFGNSQGGTSTVAQFGGWIQFTNDNTVRFALRNRGSDIASVYLSKVIGIKKKSLSTADIAEMAMPSDVYTTLTPDSNNNIEATANGYIAFGGSVTNTINNITITIMDSNNIGIYARRISVIPTNIGTFDIIAIRKGAFANIDYNNVQNVSIKFIYSIGSAKALGLL